MAETAVRLRYDEADERFCLEVLDRVTDTWGLDVACKCVRRDGDDEGEPSYVHYSILRKLAQHAELGHAIYNW